MASLIKTNNYIIDAASSSMLNMIYKNAKVKELLDGQSNPNLESVFQSKVAAIQSQDKRAYVRDILWENRATSHVDRILNEVNPADDAEYMIILGGIVFNGYDTIGLEEFYSNDGTYIPMGFAGKHLEDILTIDDTQLSPSFTDNKQVYEYNIVFEYVYFDFTSGLTMVYRLYDIASSSILDNVIFHYDEWKDEVMKLCESSDIEEFLQKATLFYCKTAVGEFNINSENQTTCHWKRDSAVNGYNTSTVGDVLFANIIEAEPLVERIDSIFSTEKSNYLTLFNQNKDTVDRNEELTIQLDNIEQEHTVTVSALQNDLQKANEDLLSEQQDKELIIQNYTESEANKTRIINEQAEEIERLKKKLLEQNGTDDTSVLDALKVIGTVGTIAVGVAGVSNYMKEKKQSSNSSNFNKDEARRMLLAELTGEKTNLIKD